MKLLLNVALTTCVFLLGLTGCGQSAHNDSPKSIPPGTVMRAATAGSGVDLSAFTLTFDEEFNKLSISDARNNDGSTWYTQTKICCGIGTANFNSSRNPFSLIPGGGLDIRAQNFNGDWSTGIISSVAPDATGFSQKYGYFEMKAKFPKGDGVWPAFWLLNTSGLQGQPSGEIDIVEEYGHWPTGYHSTLHDWLNGTVPAETTSWVADTTDGYHTYGMLWTADTMTFYFDGVANFQAPTPEIMKQPYFVLVNLGMSNYGFPENSPAINDMLVQYVRVYALNGSTAPQPAPVPAPQPPPAPAPQPAPAPAPASGPPLTPSPSGSWVHCANENELCSFSGTATVRYGANGSYATLTLTNGTSCANNIFGDPAFGYIKSCEYMQDGSAAPAPAPAPTPTPAPTPSAAGNWTYCANENGFCSFSGTATVRYGANGSYATLTATNGTGCANNIFGDPAFGYIKTCEYLQDGASAPTPAPAPTPIPVPAGGQTQTIYSSMSKMCGRIVNGQLVQSSCSQPNETFVLAKNANGTYQISPSQGQCLEETSDQRIVQRACSTSAKQTWRSESVGAFLNIKNVGSGHCLNVSGNSTAENGIWIGYNCDGGFNERFELK